MRLAGLTTYCFAILSIVIFYWFATYGTGAFFADKSEVWGTAYDHLSSSLQIGEVDVPEESIGLEGLKNKGKTFLYFGPFPALLRVVTNNIWPEYRGYWSRIFCFIAGCLCYLSALLTVKNSLYYNSQLSIEEKRSWLSLTALSLGIGTPLLFLISDSMIFLEAMLWGLCFSLLGINIITRILFQQVDLKKSVILLGLCASGALLSRVTFAVPLYLIVAFFIIHGVRGQHGLVQKIATLICLSLTGSIGIIVQAWYNYKRFGSPFISLVYQMVYPNPLKYGGEFNFLRIPISLYNFLWIEPSSFSTEPPYILSHIPRFITPVLYMDWVERVVPLSLSSPWLMLMMIYLVMLLVRHALKVEMIVVVGAFFLQAALICSWHFLTQRYQGDLLPFLIICLSLSLCMIPKRHALNLWPMTILLSLISIVATPLSTIDFHLMAVGDTGMQKTNRPLLYSLFYNRAEYNLESREQWQDINSLQVVSSQPNCTPQVLNQSLRGSNYAQTLEFSPQCSLRIELGQKYSQLRGFFALIDAVHQCEGGQAKLIIRNQNGVVIQESRVVSQRSELLLFSADLSSSEYLDLSIQYLTPHQDCLRGFLINPQLKVVN